MVAKKKVSKSKSDVVVENSLGMGDPASASAANPQLIPRTKREKLFFADGHNSGWYTGYDSGRQRGKEEAEYEARKNYKEEMRAREANAKIRALEAASSAYESITRLVMSINNQL